MNHIKNDVTFIVNIPELSHDNHSADNTSYSDPTHGNFSIGTKFNLNRNKK